MTDGSHPPAAQDRDALMVRAVPECSAGPRFRRRLRPRGHLGALGHFLPPERPALIQGVYRALRPGGLFTFPIGTPPPLTSPSHWVRLGFDLAMRLRSALWRPPFVMYYCTSPLPAVRDDLTAAGFTVAAIP